MAIYLEKNELPDAYKESQDWSREFSGAFDEIERISSNKIRANIQSNYPKVNDGTLSVQILEMAMRRFPHLFTGRFEIQKSEPWFVELVNILWNRVIVPGADTDADFYTKFFNMILDSEKHGAAASFSFFRTSDNYTGADFMKMYIRDVLFEKGKISPTSANYMWGNFYFTKLDLLNIISRAEKEEEKAKASKSESFNNWDVLLLKDFVNKGPEGKDSLDRNATERDKNLTSSHYKLSMCFHRGFQAPFYTIIPAMGGKTVRTRKNENPSGDIPINVIYAMQTLENAYGRGIVEAAAPGQNLLDLYTQADGLATQIGMEPPIQIKGTNVEQQGLQEQTLVFGPRRKWRVGTADVSVVNTNNSVYTQLGNRISRQKSNVLNQLGSFETSISAEADNPQFSRTPAGISSLGARGNDIDNFYIGSARQGFVRQAMIMMNIHIANMQGTEAFEVADDEAERLEKAGWRLGQSRKLQLDYNSRVMQDVKTEFKPDMPNKSNSPEKEALLEGMKLVMDKPESIQVIRDTGHEVRPGEMFLEYFRQLNLPNVDKIIVPVDPTTTATTTTDTSVDDSATELAQTMQLYGLNEQDAQVVMEARAAGWKEEDIAAEVAARRSQP